MFGVEAHSIQGPLIAIATMVSPLNRKIKQIVVFEPMVRSYVVRAKRNVNPLIIRFASFDHDPILGYGIGKVKAIGRTGRDRTFDR